MAKKVSKKKRKVVKQYAMLKPLEGRFVVKNKTSAFNDSIITILKGLVMTVKSAHPNFTVSDAYDYLFDEFLLLDLDDE